MPTVWGTAGNMEEQSRRGKKDPPIGSKALLECASLGNEVISLGLCVCQCKVRL